MNDWADVRDAGGVFFCSHSAGKDSQAMYLYLTVDLGIPAAQIVVVHADLGEVEWHGQYRSYRTKVDWPDARDGRHGTASIR